MTCTRAREARLDLHDQRKNGREEAKEEEEPDQAGFSQAKAKTWILF